MTFGIQRKRNIFPVLSRDQLEVIHNASLDVMERTGVKITSEQCLRILENAGCRIDREKQIAYFPSYLVRDSLKKARSTVRLDARNSKYNLTMDGRRVHVVSWGTGNTTIDLYTGVRRASVSDDIIKVAKIANALDSYHIFWPTVTSHDVPAHIRDLYDIQTALSNSEKHVQFETGDNPTIARHLIDLASTILGGREELRKKPIMSSAHCAISPLVFEGKSVEAALEYARAGVPVLVGPASMAGVSAPVTLAGSIVVNHAEVLGVLVLLETSFPGTPFIYGGSVAPFDMRAARRAGGAVEHGLIDAGIAQLGRYCGLPSLAGGGHTTANKAGAQSSLEVSLSGLLTFANADIIEGFGGIEDGKTLAFAQFILDAEIVKMCERIVRGIEVNDETLALNVIDKVQPGGTYLPQKHTRDYLTEEHFIPSLVRRQHYETWVKDGAKGIEHLALEEARKIVETQMIQPLDEDIQAKMNNIMRDATRHLSGSEA